MLLRRHPLGARGGKEARCRLDDLNLDAVVRAVDVLLDRRDLRRASVSESRAGVGGEKTYSSHNRAFPWGDLLVVEASDALRGAKSALVIAETEGKQLTVTG